VVRYRAAGATVTDTDVSAANSAAANG